MPVSPNVATDRIALTAAIDDVGNPKARHLADILRAGGRARTVIVVDDPQNILQAQRGGVELAGLYVAQDVDAMDEGLDALLQSHTVPVYRLAPAVARRIFGSEKRSRVFALAKRPRPYALDDVTKRTGDIVILDGVRITGNIGAIIRTATALGAAGTVLINSGLVSAFDRRIIRASRGLIFEHPVVLATRTDVDVMLQRSNATLVAVTGSGTDAIRGLSDVPGRVALLLGSERAGVSPGLNALAAKRFTIPMVQGVESLNVSAAAAIALHERTHRRAAIEGLLISAPREDDQEHAS